MTERLQDLHIHIHTFPKAGGGRGKRDVKYFEIIITQKCDYLKAAVLDSMKFMEFLRPHAV